MTREVGEMMGDRRETGMGQTGEVAGRMYKGAAAVEAGAVGPGVSEIVPLCVCVCVCVSAFAVVKRHSKRKNVLTAALAEANTSGCNDVSSITTAS